VKFSISFEYQGDVDLVGQFGCCLQAQGEVNCEPIFPVNIDVSHVCTVRKYGIKGYEEPLLDEEGDRVKTFEKVKNIGNVDVGKLVGKDRVGTDHSRGQFRELNFEVNYKGGKDLKAQFGCCKPETVVVATAPDQLPCTPQFAVEIAALRLEYDEMQALNRRSADIDDKYYTLLYTKAQDSWAALLEQNEKRPATEVKYILHEIKKSSKTEKDLFLSTMENIPAPDTNNQSMTGVVNIFYVFDQDRDGQLDKPELVRAGLSGCVTKEETLNIINAFECLANNIADQSLLAPSFADGYIYTTGLDKVLKSPQLSEVWSKFVQALKNPPAL